MGLYRGVKASERLPKEDGTFYTNTGRCGYFAGSEMWWSEYDGRDYTEEFEVEFWFEELNMPGFTAFIPNTK